MYCTVLYSKLLYCIVLYNVVQYSTDHPTTAELEETTNVGAREVSLGGIVREVRDRGYCWGRVGTDGGVGGGGYSPGRNFNYSIWLASIFYFTRGK